MALLLFIALAAFSLRTWFTHDAVMQGREVVFLETDPWYHVRLIENLVANFPHLNRFDPYGQFPDGQSLPVAPLFDWLIAGASLIVGFSRPSPRTIELVCAYFPPVLGSFAVLLTYLLGRKLYDWQTGLIAGGLVAIMPSSLLSFSLLGYTDHHVAEVCFSSLVMLAILRFLHRSRAAIDNARTISRNVLLAIIAGLALSAYALVWIGASLLVAILAIWFFLQLTLDHVRARSTGYLLTLAVPLFGVPLLVVLAAHAEGFPLRDHLISLAGAAIGLPVLCLLSRAMGVSPRSRRAFPLIVVGVVAALFAVLAFVSPQSWRNILALASRFNTRGGALTLTETIPLLHGPKGWSLEPAYAQFTTGFFLALIALPIIAIRSVRSGDPSKLLFVIWSVCMFGATLAQNRFSYYFAVNVALLSAVLARWLANWLTRRFKDGPSLRRVVASFLCISLITLGWFAPNASPALQIVNHAVLPNADWRAALAWLRENTPEPFGDPNAYFAKYQTPAADHAFDYPPTAYGVMTWWDYGYWLIKMGRRIPTANPTQHSASEAAQFFLAPDEASANDLMDRFRARYVLLDALMGFLPSRGSDVATGKFSSLIAWAGEPSEKYLEVCYERDAIGRLQPVTVFYPPCYQTLYARLYIFRGQAFQPTEVNVVRLTPAKDATGSPIQEVSDWKRFSNYAEAVAFVVQHAKQGYRVVGKSPFTSCVPLDPLHDYRLIYQSPTQIGAQGGRPIAYVEAYEYAPRANGRHLTTSRRAGY